jgi:hypothetical protein
MKHNDLHLDAYEQDILDSYEAGEWLIFSCKASSQACRSRLIPLTSPQSPSAHAL